MKYIENIDEEFVLNFAKENLKDIYNENTIAVKKTGYMFPEWIVSGISKKYDSILDISLTDFKASADGEPLDSQITKLWRIALYKKFRDKYKEDLEVKLSEELNEKSLNDLIL